MGKQERAFDFVVGLSVITGLLSVIYSFFLMNIGVVDWGIFLLVIGFIVLMFIGIVFLVPRK
jgi:ABC-type multidrug transport system permease subunit